MLPKLCILHLTLGYTISDRTTEIPLQTEFDYGRKFNTTQQIGTYQPTFGIDMAQADGVTVGIPSTGTLESVTSYEDPPQNALDPVLEEWLIKAASRPKSSATEKPWSHAGENVQQYFQTFIASIENLRQ